MSMLVAMILICKPNNIPNPTYVYIYIYITCFVDIKIENLKVFVLSLISTS